MGVPDLLKFVDKAKEKNVNIVNFKGKTLAVDASCFIYKGLYSQSEDDLLGRKSTKCIDYLLKTARIIVNAGIHAVFVFDGEPLPSKKMTNDKRDAIREENKKEAMALLKMGYKDEALTRFRRSYSISKESRGDCIEALKGLKGVDVIVAPYEADAELTFLVNSGLVYAAITADSDLIVFGCLRVIYNLNVDSAMCELIEFSNIRNCFSPKLRLSFDNDLLRYMCILRGCDYFEGLKGMAFKTAEKFFSKISNRDPESFIRHIKTIAKINIGNIDKFTKEFIRANNTFLYQIIFDPRDGFQKPLNAYPEDLMKQNKDHNDSVSLLDCDNYLWYAGKLSPPNIARLLAVGNEYDKILENDIRFTIPQDVSFQSIWKFLMVQHSPMHKREEFLSNSLSQSFSRKRKSSFDKNIESEEFSAKRCSISNNQVISHANDTKENIKTEEIICYNKEEDLEIKMSSQTKQSIPLIKSQTNTLSINSNARDIVVTESKYFENTSRKIDIKLFTNNFSSNIFCNRMVSESDLMDPKKVSK